MAAINKSKEKFIEEFNTYTVITKFKFMNVTKRIKWFKMLHTK